MTFLDLYKKLSITQPIVILSRYKGETDIEFRGEARDVSIVYYNVKIKRITSNTDGEKWIELK